MPNICLNTSFCINAQSHIPIIATVIFVLAVVHTLTVSYFIELSSRLKKYTFISKTLHFLGEVEIVFGFWAFILFIIMSYKLGSQRAVEYLNNTNFSEPVFVFIIMCFSATKPVINLASLLIMSISKLISKIFRLNSNLSFFNCVLIIGPLLGSIITEPSAMTICAVLLADRFFKKTEKESFKYAMLALLLVSISIGGALTHFAAPPVIMVSSVWDWNTQFMLSHFAWKTIASISVASIVCSLIFRKQIILPAEQNRVTFDRKTPLWMSTINCFFIFTCVVYHKYTPFIIGLFFIFLGWYEVTKEYQGPLKIRESLLVGFFLAGLIILGNMQTWWVQPLIKNANINSLFFGNLIFTGVMDNAALTYLAAQITNLTLEQKLSIVSGAIAGGGLTVIANAPNPIGFGILSKYFNQGVIKSSYLFLWAIPFTLITVFFYKIF